MTPEESLVWSIIHTHRGRGAVISAEQLAEQTGLSSRTVRLHISTLVETYGLPIGSAVKAPTGYFVICNEEDFNESVGQLAHRITALAKRIAALKKSTLPVVLNQLAMELGEGA